MGTNTVEDGQLPHRYSSHHQRGTIWKIGGILLRLLVTAFSLSALILMARDKEIATIAIGPVIINIPARYSYVRAFVYLVYANGLAAIYCFSVAFALIVSLILKSGHNTAIVWLLFLLDQGITYVLLAAAAASTDTAYIARNGNSKVGWSKVCDTIGHFCHIVGASLGTTFVSVLALVILCVMSAYNLSKKQATPN